jgi:hypothetical protein
MNSLSAARMIIADARHRYRVAIYKAAGVQTVEILPKTDMSTCDNCFEIADRTYGIEEVPDLPYELCTSDMGCRCVVNNASRETDFITLKEILENLKRLTPEERKLIQSQILDRFRRRRV